MNIMYAADDNYAPLLGVSLYSLFENNTQIDEINVYIFENAISEVNKNNIELICTQYKRSLPHWIIKKNMMEEFTVDLYVDRNSITQYARLFVDELPPKLERVLYLDCDTIIKQSLLELWQMDLNGKTIAAVQDCFSKYYRKNIELEPNDVIFNSGVLLIDLVHWRQKKIEQKLLEYIIKNKGYIQQGDQGVLNAILSRDCYLLEPKYNAVTYYFDFNYKELLVYRKPVIGYYSEEQIEDAVKNPVIIHYTSSVFSNRPWIKGCRHPDADDWNYYYGLSPWNSITEFKKSKKKLSNIILNIFMFFSRPMAIRVASIFQAYIRPWKIALSKLRRGI